MERNRRNRTSPRVGPLFRWALGTVLLLGSLSCNSLKLTHADPEEVTRVEREPLPAPPGKFSVRSSQYVFLSDFELQRDLPLLQELSELREQVYKELQLPHASNLVQVFIFENRDHYDRFMKSRYPELPRRRAFFVAQPRNVGGTEDMYVYTYWGDRIQEDLRHELTHALLHSVLKDVPLWLDEGLAEYFELSPVHNGINPQHVESIRRTNGGVFEPDLARLEGLSQVQQMAPAEYREAWAWVHLMLRGKPELKTVLIAYLHQLRTNPTPGPLRPRIEAVAPQPEALLARHFQSLP